MVKKNLNLLDKIHLQKYIYLLNLYVLDEIETSLFEKYFLQIRRDDGFLMDGKFNINVAEILDSFFLDVDMYNPDSLYDPNDKFNINEIELKKRAKETLNKLNNITDPEII